MHHVVPVDRQIAWRKGRAPVDLLLDPGPEIVERVHPGYLDAAPDVVGAPQGEKVGDHLEPDLPDEPPHRGARPVRLIPEHVVPDQVGHLGHRVLRVLPPLEDPPRDRLADELVLVEVAVGEGLGLSHVVEEAGQPEDEVGRRRVDRDERVLEDVLGHGLVLRDRARDLELRAEHREQPELGEQPDPGRRPVGEEDLVQLLLDPLTRERRRERGVRLDRRGGLGVDGHPEDRREADRAEHPEGVLGEPLGRDADRADDLRVQVRTPMEWIDELAAGGRRAPGHRVHREVAAREVLMERLGERDLLGPAVVRVVSLDAIRRDLDLVGPARDDDRSEPVRVEGALEVPLDLLRPGARRDVPVLRVDAAERVAHAAADHERLVAVRDERVDDPLDVLRDGEGQRGRGHAESLGTGGDARCRGRRAARPVS